ncbi:MAG: pirin family protein [Saprospiraceae bacterium]|nr:pirin family protein [Saprospiraceae bacterium]MDW8482939.1 pirin family protein [Saprospiraceae bacterium]
MSILILPKERQGQGAFNGGEIIENKPIGFPQEASPLRPYSNLFYWAHARALKDSTIGLHPHRGFEICSFVLAGEIRHYDTKLREWRPLRAGDAQIIRAGNGISHSEWMSQGAEMFQIWFDPNLDKTLSQPASYDDYRLEQFPTHEKEGVSVRTVVGAGSPFYMDTPGVKAQYISLRAGARHRVELASGEVASAYVVRGILSLNGQNAQTSDFVLITDERGPEMEAIDDAEVFVIVSPADPGYLTYEQRRRR